MKNGFPITLSLALTAMSLSALAHDPSLHKKKDAAPPDCARMQDMDLSKMDMNDPLMKALHDKCKNALAHDHMQGQDMKDMPDMEKKIEQPTDSGGK